MKIDNLSVTQSRTIEPTKGNLNRGNNENPLLNKENRNNNKSENKVLDKKEVEKALEIVNDTLEMMDKKLSFQLHEGTNRTLVKVTNRETEEVIREIPPEEILDLVAKMTELVGIMMDKRV